MLSFLSCIKVEYSSFFRFYSTSFSSIFFLSYFVIVLSSLPLLGLTGSKGVQSFEPYMEAFFGMVLILKSQAMLVQHHKLSL